MASTRAPLVLGLVGKRRSGKDTVAEYLKRHHDFVQYAFADPLKAAVGEIFCFSHEQLHGDKAKEAVDERWGTSPRRVLQLVGTELFRKRFLELIAPEAKAKVEGNGGFWVHRFKLWYQGWRAENPEGCLVVSDIRFQDEADVILALGGTVVRIERSAPGAAKATSAHVATHASEQVDGIQGAAHVLENDGTIEELYGKAEELVAQLRA